MTRKPGERCEFPPNATIRFEDPGEGPFRLETSQVLPLSPEQSFAFFEDPRNLSEITPDWLDFRMTGRGPMSSVYEGAEFDYTIRWLGVPIPWRGRIADYHRPERFTDIQVRGPYRSWVHLHVFRPVPEGTLMKDTVTYEVPYGQAGRLVHRLLIRRQLEDIFRYRAIRISEWASGDLRRKSHNPG